MNSHQILKCYFNKNNTVLEAKNLYERSWKFIAVIPNIWRGNIDSLRKFAYENLGTNFNMVSERDYPELLDSDEFKNMNIYPKKESIKIIDDTVVIKLSE